MRHALRVLGMVCAFLSTEASAEIGIEIANYKSYWQYTLIPEKGTLKVTTTSTKKIGGESPQHLEAILRDIHTRQVKRTGAIAQMSPETRSNYRWAAPSPNCKYFLAGPEHAEFDVLRNVTLGRDDPWTPITQISLKNDQFIKDFAWSSDSQFLVIVETSQHYGGGIGAIAGHPTPHDKLSVAIISTTSGSIKRIPLAKDITYATVIVRGEDGKCPNR